MNTTNLAANLNRAIDRHAAGHPTGKIESHDMDSLSRRILAPRKVVEKLLATGALLSAGPIYLNDETGRHAFFSNALNKVKRAVLRAVTVMTINDSDSPSQVATAASHALGAHKANFSITSGEKTELSRFPAGLVKLSRYYRQDEEPGLAERTATTVGKVAAIGGIGYGAAALLRGRKLNPGASILEQVRQGSAANIATIRAIGGRLSAGAAKVDAVLRGQIRR